MLNCNSQISCRAVTPFQFIQLNVLKLCLSMFIVKCLQMQTGLLYLEYKP